MSHSPESRDGLTPADPNLTAYLKNFDTLGALISQGRSFSGRERNCSFLNTGRGRFSDVSAATGLDFMDDGRGVALVDWDHDGDLDFWVSNRTSPRLRFVKNDMPTQNHFLALKVEGRDCNRDAIGARVEVVVESRGSRVKSRGSRVKSRGSRVQSPEESSPEESSPEESSPEESSPEESSPEESSPGSRVQSPEQGRIESNHASLSTPDSRLSTLTKSVRAGSSFLSQSSKWLHFGLGPSGRVERVVVHWPGSDQPEIYSDIQVDRRYRIVQGSGRPVLVDATPREVTLTPSKPAVTGPVAPAGASRLVLSRRQPLPKISIQDFDGKPQPIEVASNRGLLITLWASWCTPCRAELAEWAKRAADLRNREINVMALATDGLLDGKPDGTTTARRFLSGMRWPFSSGMASEQAIRELTLFQHQLVYPQRPLPLPSSFLIDSDRNVAVIYRGPIPFDQLLKDLELLDASAERIAISALPFSGKFAGRRFRRDSIAHVVAYLEGGYLDDAKRELLTFIDENAGNIESGISSGAGRDKKTLADAYRLLANLEKEEGRYAESIAAYRRLVKLLPNHATARISLAIAHWQAENRESALRELDNAAKLVPDEARMLHLLAQSYEKVGEDQKALRWYHRAVDLDPSSVRYRANLAAFLQSHGKSANAVEHYRRVLQEQPDRIDAANNLAWILATHRDRQVRNPLEALRLATRIAKQTNEDEPTILDTFAAALASAGQYERAAKVATKAIKLARQRQNSSIAEKIESRLQLYRQSKPYQEPESN